MRGHDALKLASKFVELSEFVERSATPNPATLACKKGPDKWWRWYRALGRGMSSCVFFVSPFSGQSAEGTGLAVGFDGRPRLIRWLRPSQQLQKIKTPCHCQKPVAEGTANFDSAVETMMEPITKIFEQRQKPVAAAFRGLVA